MHVSRNLFLVTVFNFLFWLLTSKLNYIKTALASLLIRPVTVFNKLMLNITK